MLREHFLEPAQGNVLLRNRLGHLRQGDAAERNGERRRYVIDDQGTRHRQIDRPARTLQPPMRQRTVRTAQPDASMGGEVGGRL